MKNKKNEVTFKQRYLGIAVLVVVQVLVGVIHLFFGLAMVLGNFSFPTPYPTNMIYSVYTLVYGFLTILFTYWVWKQKRSGWIGTLAISLFVIIVDFLAFLNITNFLGIADPKIAAMGEIPYSSLCVAYLLLNHVRSKYKI
jgi:hypothetical protein